MRRPHGIVVALAIGLAGSVALAQEPGPAAGRAIADIRDHAGVFGADAIASARGELERIARETGTSVIIETFDTTGGEPADRFAIDHARRSGIHGVYILVARKEHKLEVLGSGHYRDILGGNHRRAIIEAFSEGFRRQDFNEGLKHGVAELARVIAAARRVPASAPRAPVPEAPSGLSTGMAAVTFGSKAPGDSPLVARNQVRLTLAGARAIIAGAAVKADSMGWKMNIAVVDDGGHLIAFERMEGARPASVYTALTKATTAATLRQPSGPLPAGTTNPDPLLNLSLQNAAAASGGKITTLYGGVPVVVDGQVIGGVGVGGGTGEQDAQAARAGIQAFLDQLSKPAAAAKEGGTQGNPKSGEKAGAASGPSAGSDF
jgi:glc operon protein GlcG